MIKVLTSPDMGRGLYAMGTIPANTVIMTCEILVLDQLDTVKVNDTSLQYYTFKFNDTQDCLVLGLGEIFNHADQPNVSYQLVPYDGRFVMEFRSLTQIEANCQLFIDYNADTLVNVGAYKKQASLVA